MTAPPGAPQFLLLRSWASPGDNGRGWKALGGAEAQHPGRPLGHKPASRDKGTGRPLVALNPHLAPFLRTLRSLMQEEVSLGVSAGMEWGPVIYQCLHDLTRTHTHTICT